MEWAWLNWFLAVLPTIVAIGWSIEKILRLLDTLLPDSVTIDNDLAEFLGRMLKLIGNILRKND